MADAASPRAVLSGASAMLISQASVAQQRANCKAKSLLSDRLAGALPHSEVHGRRAFRSACQVPDLTSPHVAAAKGSDNCITSKVVYYAGEMWQEPPIRTVRMQGNHVLQA